MHSLSQPAKCCQPHVLQFDIKNKKHFLKRVKCTTVGASQLYVGSIVTVFARQLHIIAYGDEATRRAVEARAERWVDLARGC